MNKPDTGNKSAKSNFPLFGEFQKFGLSSFKFLVTQTTRIFKSFQSGKFSSQTLSRRLNWPIVPRFFSLFAQGFAKLVKCFCVRFFKPNVELPFAITIIEDVCIYRGGQQFRNADPKNIPNKKSGNPNAIAVPASRDIIMPIIVPRLHKPKITVPSRLPVCMNFMRVKFGFRCQSGNLN